MYNEERYEYEHDPNESEENRRLKRENEMLRAEIERYQKLLIKFNNKNNKIENYER